MRPAAVGYQCPECLATEQSSGYRPQRGVASLRTPPRVTQVLIAINVAVFIVEIVTGDGGIFDVHVDGELVFTKSMLGRYPDPDDVVPLLRPKLA
jgi:hypothetical protein